MLPLENGTLWCILSVPKYAIINQKINNSKVNKSTIDIFSSSTNPDVHVNKQLDLHFIRGVSWGHPPEAKIYIFF